MATRIILTSYKWQIKDFNQQILTVENGGSIKSDIFSLNNHSKAKFSMKLKYKSMDYCAVYLVCDDLRSEQELQLDVKLWWEKGEDKRDMKSVSELTVSKTSNISLLHPSYSIYGMKSYTINDVWTFFCEITHEEPIDEFEEDTQEDLIAHREFNRKVLKFYSNGSLDMNVTIKVGNKEFKSGKFALMACSEIFSRMFSCENSIEANTGIIQIEETKPETIDALIRWVYQVEIDNIEEVAMDLYRVADKYQIGFLKKKCIKIMTKSLSVENIASRLILAHTFNEEQLKKQILNFVRMDYNNLKRLVVSDKWLKFGGEYPEEAKKILAEIPD